MGQNGCQTLYKVKYLLVFGDNTTVFRTLFGKPIQGVVQQSMVGV